MSVYVGIDVHRKRSQVAVVTGEGKVQVNRNVVNGVEPVLRLIGGLPAGTPVAFEAAYGWGWLVELLTDYGFDPHLVHPLRCKAIASARLKNDKVDAAWRSCCGRICCRRRGSPRRRCASCGRCCAIGPAWSGWGQGCATASMPW
jgi:transposase